jgi:arylsulfatase A-like enzyme
MNHRVNATRCQCRLKQALALFIACLPPVLAYAERPNILFIFSDDHATQALSAYGHPISELASTPHLDRLANEGMRFDRCMVTNSICGPSRATILTGKYSHLNGFIDNVSPPFDGSQPTFPKLLQRSGYDTAIFGKWHLKSEPTGFDHWEVLPGQGLYYRPEFRTPDGRVTEEGYVSEIVTDKALDWLETRQDSERPFMLMVQHKAPHREWSPPTEYLDLFDGVKFPEPETLFSNHEKMSEAARQQDMSIGRSMSLDKDMKVIDPNEDNSILYKRVLSRLTPAERLLWNEEINERVKSYEAVKDDPKELVRWKFQTYLRDYLATVRTVDDSVGALLAYLDESGLAENTVVIYSSDQGFYLGEHGWFDKRFMYDESYRTPLLVRWPGITKAGSESSKLTSNLDFAQTFLEIAGVEADPEMQGMSLVPLLAGEPVDWRVYHYYHYYEYPGAHMVYRHEGVYDGRYKLIHYYDVDEWELLDTLENPQETENRYGWSVYAAEVARLKAALEDLKERYEVPAGIPERIR